MISRITLSQILLIFFLPSLAVDAQSRSPHDRDPSFDPVVVPLVFVFLFVACCSILLRHCSNMGLARAATRCSSGDSQRIDPELLKTFPILVCSAVKNLKFGKDANQCAVCLSEFDERDNLRLLPKCNHLFHPQCIDAWLASHVTCPVCRSRLTPAEEHGGGHNEVVIVIPNDEIIDAHQVFDGSSESRTELDSGDLRSLGRCHSTGHSLGLSEIGEKDRERYTIRVFEDVLKKQVKNNDGGIRRSASYNVLWGRAGEQKMREHLIL